MSEGPTILELVVDRLEELRRELADRLDVPLDRLDVTVSPRETEPLITIRIHR